MLLQNPFPRQRLQAVKAQFLSFLDFSTEDEEISKQLDSAIDSD